MRIQQFITNKGCIAFISFFLLISCSSNGGEEESGIISQDIIPENLSIEVTIIGADSANVYGNGSGEIQVIATALNAVSYLIKFGDGNEASNNTGIFDHSYTAQGLNPFTIQVFATSTTGNIIGGFQRINVLYSFNGMTLIWSDEFNTDGAPDATNWTYDLGDGGWGNGEVQTYTNSADNVKVTDGSLVITAKADGSGGYTSARLKSQGLRKFTFGRIEVKAKLPAAQGTWPAIWMLGSNFSTVGWPTCGEIDIMEQTGANKDITLGTVHWYNTATNTNASAGENTAVANASSEFHLYTVEWSDTSIKMYLDDVPFYEFANNATLPFNADFFMILNIAMGGTLGGDIDSGFTEDTMEIDYVKVFQ